MRHYYHCIVVAFSKKKKNIKKCQKHSRITQPFTCKWITAEERKVANEKEFEVSVCCARHAAIQDSVLKNM